MDRRVVPARQHGLRRLEAHGVVHHGRAPDAAALQYRKAKVLCLLECTVGVQLADHLDLVLGEVARLHVTPALHYEHLTASFCEVVSEDGAARPAPNDAN